LVENIRLDYPGHFNCATVFSTLHFPVANLSLIINKYDL
jgi:hypothetical protein